MILTGLAWAPKCYDFQSRINQIINENGLEGLNVVKGPEKMPGLTKPTFFLTNEFTAVF
jgi:hypothetical protein